MTAPQVPVTDPPDVHRLGYALALALLAWSVVANLGLGDRFYVGRNLLLTFLLLVLARAVGLTTSDLGLGRIDLARGRRWGLAAVAVVAVVLGLAVGVADRFQPVAALLGDQRASLPSAEVAYQAAVRIPLGTALFEEVAFRGVLLALFVRTMGIWRATVTSSVVFGLWHVAPAIVALRINGVVPASAGGVGAVVSTVLVTTVAGVLFCLLRWRSGSLLAPVLAHWATNALGLVAAATTEAG
jgi:uncharacterized protein